VPQARKQFGQHWLKSEKALSRIVAAANLKDSDRVLEIGPGTGILTRQLLTHAAAVVAVEIDRRLGHGVLSAKSVGSPQRTQRAQRERRSLLRVLCVLCVLCG